MWALQQVGSYLGYTGHHINVVVTAARGSLRSIRSRLTLTEPRRLGNSAMLLRQHVNTSVQRY